MNAYEWKRTNRWVHKLLSLLCILCWIGGCESVQPPPYVIVSCQISDAACENFEHIGLLLEVRNVAPQQMTSLSFEMRITDSEGEPYPDYYNSRFNGICEMVIEPYTTLILAIPIEDLLILIPSEPLIVSQIHIYEVIFDSGDKWIDEYGIYLLEF